MQLSFKGRIRNVSLPYTHALLPLFEAVINSIHAIEDAKKPGGAIRIEIQRDTGGTEGFSTIRASGNITGFTVHDNGIGFTKENFTSFETSDSEYKKDRGAKGVGRFMWLKAFSSVKVSSVHLDAKKTWRRTFDFSVDQDGIHNPTHIECPLETSYTKVELMGFQPRYVAECPKKAETIADKIVEHCLFYFLDPNCPKVELIDTAEGDRVLVNERYRKIVPDLPTTTDLTIGADLFHLQHIHLYATDSSYHEVHFCGDRRDVLQSRLALRIPELKQKLTDADGEPFTYYLYVSGKPLDASVNAERTDFNIPKEGPIGMNGELTLEGIMDAVVAAARRHLNQPLTEIRSGIRKRVDQVVATHYPEYRQTVKYLDGYPDIFVPSMREEEIALKLNEIQFREDIKTREEAKSIVEKEPEDDETFQKQLDHYMDRMGDFRQSRLTQYVIHRKCILEIMRKRLNFKKDDKYDREEELHKVIFPLKKTSDDIDWNSQNLWLIDERLAYHHYLASDKPFCSYLEGSQSKDRADLVVFDNPSVFNDTADEVLPQVTIVEFKRPQRDKYGGLSAQPIEQVYRYIQQIEDGKITSISGRPIKVHPGTQYHCYIICDITEALLAYFKAHDIFGTPDKDAFYIYNKHYRAYIEILSFNSLLKTSEARNKVLFKTLGITP